MTRKVVISSQFIYEKVIMNNKITFNFLCIALAMFSGACLPGQAKSLSPAKSGKPAKPVKSANSGKAAIAPDDLSATNVSLAKLNAAIIVSPESYALYHNRAAYYMAVHNYPKALKDMNKAVALSNRNTSILDSRSKLYLAMKDYPNALTDLNFVVNDNPGNSQARFVRSTVLVALKQYDKALADLNLLLKANPRTGYAYAARGSVFMNLQKPKQAMADYNAALFCNFQNSQILSDMYKEYLKEQKYNLALSPLNRLIASTNESPAKVLLYRDRLDLYSKLEHSDPNLVANDLLKIGDLEPDNVDVHMQFATSQWQRQPSLALQALTQVLKVQPTNASALSLRARLQVEHNLNAEAIQDCNKAIEVDPRSAINFSTRAKAHLSDKHYEPAIADASAAIALQPDLAEPYYTEGYAYQALQRNQESLAAYNQYLQLMSKDANPSDDDAAQIEDTKRRIKFVEGSLATIERQNAVRSQNEAKSK